MPGLELIIRAVATMLTITSKTDIPIPNTVFLCRIYTFNIIEFHIPIFIVLSYPKAKGISIIGLMTWNCIS